MEFNEKVVLITGASSGIGAATAIYLSKLSAKLALVGRKETNLRRIALYCEKAKGVKPLAITADVTDDGDAERIIRETVEHFGKLDVLVNNAGVIGMGGIKNSNMETYDKVMTTNMRSVYHLTMLAVPHLTESKGCIVNISSIASTKPSTMALAYNISKAAVDHFTKCVALELAADGIRVNSVNPGFVKSNLLRDIGLSDDQLELFVKNVVGNMPLKKPVEGDEVAALIAFLASDKAKSITGSHYVIDGGSLLR
ncbi:uncharacterized oxidoreductase TM_0325 [Manduca sexta]|uniref:Ketoreductase domain-containing protein n=1 Tax=Manduca sexta TaxID=7130 RepID=A0A921Z4Y0_MANSE|nr:uncharacterized oxidoreductase TM_0325 [Manduca sexta]KAG6451483.1 hypothetical protein O3G_MSEX007174 [Manduca sexta]